VLVFPDWSIPHPAFTHSVVLCSRAPSFAAPRVHSEPWGLGKLVREFGERSIGPQENQRGFHRASPAPSKRATQTRSQGLVDERRRRGRRRRKGTAVPTVAESGKKTPHNSVLLLLAAAAAARVRPKTGAVTSSKKLLLHTYDARARQANTASAQTFPLLALTVHCAAPP